MIRIFTIILFFIVSFSLSAQDRLISDYGTASDVRSGRKGSFKRLASASLDVSNIDKVLVVASFDTKYDRRTTIVDGFYKLTDGTSESEFMMLSLRSTGGRDKGIGTLIYIFDASSLSGTKNYRLEHSSSSRELVKSSGTIVAISLSTSESGVEIPYDLKSTLAPVSTSGTLNEWTPVNGMTTAGIPLVDDGAIYVSASVNSVANESGSGEWKLQYSSNQSNWNDLGYPSTRSFSNQGEYGISALSWVIQDLQAGTWYFRLVHRQTKGTPGDLTTNKATLAACALIFEVAPGITREFASFSMKNSLASTTGTSMAPVISHSIDPSNSTDLFLQAQYGNTADASLNAAGYDLAIDQTILDGTDQFRYISSSTEESSGGSVGLGVSMQAGTSYGISLRHMSAAGINLHTQNATLAGFQLTSVGNSVWTGTGLNPTVWENSDNWIGEAPGQRDNAIIPAGADNYPILFAPTSCQDLYLNIGGSLMLESASNLTIHGLSEINGTLELKSSSSATGSLIVYGESTGSITFNNYLTANRWYIVSPPVVGQPIKDFLENPNNRIPYSTSFEAYGLTDYNEVSNSWNSFFTASTPGDFETGKGYLMRREISDGPVSYTGELMDADFQFVLAALGSGWNAVGNPFPSSIGVTSDASSTENFLTTNLDQLDPNYSVLYLWDEQAGYTGTQNNYKVIGNAGYTDLYNYEELDMDYLQAGQGFLVKSVSGGGSLRFTKAMQTHLNSIGMVKSAGKSWDGFKLIATSGERSESTIVCFHDAMTLGLDPSYDAGLLNSKPDFSIYTRLPEEDVGIGFKVQCLPYQSDSIILIPMGVDLMSGGELTFSSAGVLLGDTIQIFLEDRLTGTFTDFTAEGSSYGVVIEEGSQDSSRFFLHIKILNTTGTDFDPYQTSSLKVSYFHPFIAIHGTVGEGATANLIDMAGRSIGTYSLHKGERNEIPVPSLGSGVYLLAVVDGPNRTILKILKN